MRRTAFTSYMCLNSALLANFALNGSCGVPRNISFAPCRCASERERDTEGVSECEGGREEREREERERELCRLLSTPVQGNVQCKRVYGVQGRKNDSCSARCTRVYSINVHACSARVH